MLLTAGHRSDGSLAAILPLYLASDRPVRVVRFIGHGPADQLGPVTAPHERAAVAAALPEALAAHGVAWDVVLAERLGTVEERVATGGVTLRTEPSPTLRIDGSSWDEFLAGRSRNFREQVRRRERKAIREHSLVYRRCQDLSELEADLETLFALHARRWAGGESAAFSPPLRAFHRDFAALALECGWLRLWLAEVDGRPVAAWLGYRFAGADWYYQAGRDPEWDRASIGFVLMAHTVRDAFEAGSCEYKLLLGGEEYKARFATEDRGLATVALARGPRGRMATLAARSAIRLPPAARRTIGRLMEGSASA